MPRSDELDDRLEKFLDQEEKEETRELVRSVGKALLDHQRGCDERWKANAVAHASAHARIAALEAGGSRQVVEVTHARAPMPSHPAYEPEEDSRGNLVVPSAEWQKLQLERAAEHGQRVGAEAALSKVRGRVSFWLPLTAAVAGAGAWLVEHFRAR